VLAALLAGVPVRVLAALLAVVLFMPGCGWEGRSGQGHLVLLIIVDTLRADRLGCYGYDEIDTPTIDALADAGILFEQAVTAVPVTLPSISTLLTGVYPLQHGIRDNGPFRLGASWTTLAERFSACGFRTAAFVSAAVIGRQHGLDQGFEVYDDDMSGAYTVYDPELKPFSESVAGVERRADATVACALEWARQHSGEDVFLMVHLFDPHIPQDPPPPYNELYASPYDGEIAFVDDQIGQLLEPLREGWAEEHQLIAFVSDHGEGLGDHGEDLHGFLLYEETMHVPFILSGWARPDSSAAAETVALPTGIRLDDLVRTIDVAPTLCALMGMDPPSVSSGHAVIECAESGPARTGARPVPAAAEEAERLAYLETFRPRLSHKWSELQGLRTQDWKYIHGPRDELYNLSKDSAETMNLVEQMPAMRDSLHELMTAVAFTSLARGHEQADEMTLSPEQEERLRSLGYLTATSRDLPQNPARVDSQAVWFFPPAQRGVALELPNPADEIGPYNRDLKMRSRYRQGILALENGELDQAEFAFKRALEQVWDHADSWVGLIQTYERAKDRRLPNVLREAHQTCPDDERIALHLARFLVDADRTEDAWRVLRETFDRNLDLEGIDERLRRKG
jgi:arylsulfatase A-like enzyme